MGEELIITDDEGSPVFRIDPDTNKLIKIREDKEDEKEKEDEPRDRE